MRIIIFSLLATLGSISLYGQSGLNQDVNDLSSVELYKLPALDNNKLQLRHKKADGKLSPLRFAEQRDVSIIPEKHGTWEQTKDNKLVWRQRILSPNAYTLNLGFTQFYLPTSAKLYIYNNDKSDIIGPLTTADNDDHMQYWTPMIRGEEIVIELQIVPEDKNALILELSRVNHDFLDIQKSLSGSCNVDVECGEDDGLPLIENYRDIIRAVGAYTLGGIDACSGTLVNNQRGDCTPYFLTADHCGIRNNSAPSVVVFWNYQNSTCREPNSIQSGRIGDGLRNQFNSGSSLKATLNDSDITLIELDDPIDPALDLYFAGWNRQNELPDSTICIHHPGVEEKRISFDFDPPVYDPTGSDTTHIRILDWDIGTTEGGSSGSGLFNTQGQLIGQLTGGFAACGNNEWDTYGWMNYSWDRGPSASTRLQPYLDPDNTGIISLNGKSCSYDFELETLAYELCSGNANDLEIAVQPAGAYTGNVSYSVTGIPNGVNASFDFTDGDSGNQNNLTLSGLSNIGQQQFDIEIFLTDGSNEVSKQISIDVYDAIPSTPSIEFPADGLENTPLSMGFVLARGNVFQNQFQVATDADFNSIIADQNVEINEFVIEDLQQNTEYFWRTRSVNPCGPSDWTTVRSFRTTLQFCATVSSFSDPVIIDDGPPSSISSMLNFPYLANISNVDVTNISGVHSYVGDLSVSLSFDGETSVLFSDICFSNDDFNLGFSDGSTIDDFSCPPTDGRIYKPDTPLEVFNSSVGGGEWMLRIDDTANNDGGIFESWRLDICYTNPVPPIMIPSNNILSGCANSEISLDVYIDSGIDIPNFEVLVIDNLGNSIPSRVETSANDVNLTTLTVTPDISSNGQISLQMINMDSGVVEFFTLLMLDITDSGSQAVVSVPANDVTYDFNTLSNIVWDSNNFEGNFTVEISDDASFSNIVFSANGSGDNNIDIDVVGFEIAEYYLRVVNDTDCGLVYSETVKFNIDNTSSLADIDKEDVVLYPNPTNDIIYIQSNIDLREANALLISADGKIQVPYSEIIGDQLLSIDVLPYAEGIYFVQLTDGDRTIRKRVVIID